MAAQPPLPTSGLAPCPILALYPLDDSFTAKRITLGGPAQRVKIARPPNTKTLPAERNGFFDSRVLSRQHAEVWEEDGKMWIKDVKSSNGTFLNGERLSPESRESEPCELKTDDILEFGVDIVSEDNKTILHRKVVARVACIFPGQPMPLRPPPPLPQHTQQQQLLQQQQQQQNAINSSMLAGLGGMGAGGVRVPGRGLTLDHIFSRLQAELAKSRDTGHDLQVLTGALGGIEESLNGGSLSDPAPRLPDSLPPVRPPPARSMTLPAVPTVPPVETNLAQSQAHADAIADLQSQLREHQRALTAHVESIRALETVLKEQEEMKREFSELRAVVGVGRKGEEDSETDQVVEDDDDDDDDARSIVTAVAHDLTLERVEEESEAEADDFQILARERAQTPEPSEAEAESFEESNSNGTSLAELTNRLASLGDQLESALVTSAELKAQHAEARETIAALEEKLAKLESTPPMIAPLSPPPPPPVANHASELEELQSQLTAMRAELAAERGKREEWIGAVDERIRLFTAAQEDQKKQHLVNGHVWAPAKRHSGSSSSTSSSETAPSPPPAYIGIPNANGDVVAAVDVAAVAAAVVGVEGKALEPQQQQISTKHTQQVLGMQTAVGFLVLGIAAAAVVWRVKPQ